MGKKKRAIIFGVFDGIHDGHRDLFRQAKEYAEELVAIVGRDSASVQWKGKKPRHSEQERLSLVLNEELVDHAVLGDEEQSTYRVLRELQPDVICLGYDQEALAGDLKPWLQSNGKSTPLILLKPFKPETYHNSFF